jgi:phosphoribosyl-ATP pyrophosphohydrolase
VRARAGEVSVLRFTHPLHETLLQKVRRESHSLWVSASRGYETSVLMYKLCVIWTSLHVKREDIITSLSGVKAGIIIVKFYTLRCHD